MRVPIQQTGADRLVVVMKLTKVSGAKGSNYPSYEVNNQEIGRN